MANEKSTFTDAANAAPESVAERLGFLGGDVAKSWLQATIDRMLKKQGCPHPMMANLPCSGMSEIQDDSSASALSGQTCPAP